MYTSAYIILRRLDGVCQYLIFDIIAFAYARCRYQVPAPVPDVGRYQRQAKQAKQAKQLQLKLPLHAVVQYNESGVVQFRFHWGPLSVGPSWG